MTDGLTCQELVELVTDYLDGALLGADVERFESHLAICPGCSTYVDQFRETIRLTGRLRVDDLVFGVYVLSTLLVDTDSAILREHWSGREDVLLSIQKVLNAADSLLAGSALASDAFCPFAATRSFVSPVPNTRWYSGEKFSAFT